MPFIPKTSRREHSAETIAIIISMQEESKSHAQIGDLLKLAKSTVTRLFIVIIDNKTNYSDQLSRPASHLGIRSGFFVMLSKILMRISKRLALPQNSVILIPSDCTEIPERWVFQVQGSKETVFI